MGAFALLQGHQQRQVKHLQFLKWRGEQADVNHAEFLGFVREARKQIGSSPNTGPVVVHCWSVNFETFLYK